MTPGESLTGPGDFRGVGLADGSAQDEHRHFAQAQQRAGRAADDQLADAGVAIDTHDQQGGALRLDPRRKDLLRLAGHKFGFNRKAGSDPW